MSSVLYPAALIVAAPISAWAQTAPHLPDLSAYDCAVVSPDTTVETRHIGQVIKGGYNEWQEYYVLNQGQRRLACIGLTRPTTRQLSAADAKTFLTDSLAIGAPVASPAEAALDRQQAIPNSEEPANVQAEPLKRVRKPSASNGIAEQKSNVIDVPPLPASKNFDGDSSAPAPTKERTQTFAPAESKIAPATIGVEDRTQIVATQTNPWYTMAYLSATYPSGSTFRCSATLVSPYVVLTAGHCIHNNTRGGYITSARVYPGQTQSVPTDNTPVRPYGFKSDIQSLQTTAQWTHISGEDSYVVTQYRHDIAAIEFKTPFTHTNTFMPVLYSNTGATITSVGYPGEINNNTNWGLYGDTGTETAESFSSYHPDHIREFAVDASGGNSGGPFLYADPNTGQRYVVGSLSYAEDTDDMSGGPWYDSFNQALISGWVSWTPATAAAGTVNGLRVASVFGTAQPNMFSFLRFYNSSTTAGTVDVTLADYASGAILATWTSPSLPGRSSRQFSIQQIEDNASATFTKPLVYSVSVRPTFTGNFQNVLLRKMDGTVTNVTACDLQAGSPTTLMNVHSSILQTNYPSAVIIHNTGSSAASPPLIVHDASDGHVLGIYPTATIPANSQLILSIAAIEAGAGISPGSTIYHYNIRVSGTFTGYLQHMVNNVAAGVTSDMTTSCVLAP